MPSETPSSAVKSRLADLSGLRPDEVRWNIRQTIDASPDSAAALLASAQLDVALEQAISCRFVGSEKIHRQHLFEGSSPLASTVAKIHLAYALGIFGEITRDDMLKICRVRNIFAHARVPLDFNTQAIKNTILSMKSQRAYAEQNMFLLNPDFDWGSPRSVFISTCLSVAFIVGAVGNEMASGNVKETFIP